MTADAGRRIKLRYVVTTDAASTLTVARRGRTIARMTKSARAGVNAIAWKPKSNARTGIYTLKLRAVGAGGQSSTAKATLKLR